MYSHRTLGLTPAGTICRSNLSFSHYPIRKNVSVVFEGHRKVLKGGGGNKAIILVPLTEKPPCINLSHIANLIITKAVPATPTTRPAEERM